MYGNVSWGADCLFEVDGGGGGGESGRKVPYRTYFRTDDAVHFHVAVCLALSHDCLKGCPASSSGRVSVTLNIERCKPLSTRVRLHSGSFCLDMFVNGLAVICRSRWFHRANLR